MRILNHLTKFTFLILFLIGCNPTTLPEGQRSLLDETSLPGTGGSGALPGSEDEVVSVDDSPPTVEIRHLVEPYIEEEGYGSGIGTPGAGTYVRKLTLPKNYSGYLYIGGINITSLRGRITKVRLSFGQNSDPITLDATVTNAPGITPNVQIDVLAIDLRDKPFQNLRLNYDLYDYNDYSDPDTEVIQNNRNNLLYCRGLELQDDPTFNGIGSCDGLDLNGDPLSEKCLYSYAKIKDKGLVKFDGTTYTQLYPGLAQIDISGDGYYKNELEDMLSRCLPDQSDQNLKFSEANAATGLSAVTFSGFANTQAIDGENYIYEGAFLPINSGNWQISGDALFGETGLFDMPVPAAINLDYGYNSLLFPRNTKLDLSSGVEHLSSAAPFSAKSVQSLNADGESEYMEGCNLRVASVNPAGEHPGSCNVSAKIELIALDNDLNEYVVTETNDIVLQIVRPSQITEQDGEVLYGNFKTCSNSNECGSDECCFNNRCWSDSLVTQCLEEAESTGNRGINQACTSDYQCSSLCCDQTKGTCQTHNNFLNPPQLCNKPFNATCPAKEWCKQSVVTECFIVRTGSDLSGNTTCAKRCYSRLEHGDCKNGVCAPPVQPTDTTSGFDPNAPDACDDAIDPPDFSG